MDIIESFDEIQPLLEQGFLYANGRDRKMRPNLIFKARKVIDNEVTVEDLVKLNVFWSAYLIFNGLVPGKIEQFNLIVDMSDVALHEIPIQRFGGMMARTKMHFAQRMSYSGIIKLSWFLQKAVNMITVFLDEFQSEKVNFYSNDYKATFDERFGL